MKRSLHGVILMAFLLSSPIASHAQAYRNPYGKLPSVPTSGDQMFASYLRSETEKLERGSLTYFPSLREWTSARDKLRGELFEMLGLDPMPPKADINAVVTGKLEHPEFTVEKLHFQSRPGLYVTANVYVPKNLSAPAPAILYVCGHAQVKTNGVSYGNKVAYQHHGIWFARNGYVCLVMDTVQLGEIEGVHHGTHREGMWWWNSRGYTAAGAEAWNCIRALDYLQSRKDVDGGRLGVTGRSGGGAYSWWVAALDERVRVACPVAGITDLRNYVMDGAVEGHCDCMFMVNTYRWDFAQVAALVAPRPLLLCNTDKDTIFPLDGVTRVHAKTRAIYDLYDAPDKFGLLITEGPHKDTQELQLPVMRWFNKWLKKSQTPVESAATPLFSPQQLKVFGSIPADEKTSRCYEDFTALASNDKPLDVSGAIAELRRKTFGGWPEEGGELAMREVSALEKEGVKLSVYEFESQPGVRLRFYTARSSNGVPRSIRLTCMDAAQWESFHRLAAKPFGSILHSESSLPELVAPNQTSTDREGESAKWLRQMRESGEVHAFLAPRGIGMTAITGEARYMTQIRRRFMLLGQTLSGMQVWDLRRATQALRGLSGMADLPLALHASPQMTEVAAFAAVFQQGIDHLELFQAPRSDTDAPDFLNWRRIVTPEQLLKLAGSKCRVDIAKVETRPKK